MAKRTLSLFDKQKIRDTVYGNTTFTVARAKPEMGKISYSDSAKMWDGLIWPNINRIFSNISGNASEAKEIEDLFNILLKATISPMLNNKLNIGLTSDEAGWMQEIINTVNIKESYNKGDAFEVAIANLIDNLLDDIEGDIYQGTSQVSSIRFQAGQVDVGIRKFRKALLEDAKNNGRKDIYNLVYRLEGPWKKGELRDVTVRTQLKSGKIDIFAGTAHITLKSGLSPKMELLASKLKAHTYSLKNYGSNLITLGHSDMWRTLPAFYYATTKNTNYSDLARFLFATDKSTSTRIPSYRSVANAIYELTGVGLETNLGGSQTRAVDYLMVLLPGPRIKIRSTRVLVEEWIKNRNNFAFSGQISI